MMLSSKNDESDGNQTFETGRNRNNINSVRNDREKWMKEQGGTIRGVRNSSISKTTSVHRRMLGFIRRSSYNVVSRIGQSVRCICQTPCRLLCYPMKWGVGKTKHLYRKLTLRNELTVKDVETQLGETKPSENLTRSQRIALERKEQRYIKELREQKSRYETYIATQKAEYEKQLEEQKNEYDYRVELTETNAKHDIAAWERQVTNMKKEHGVELNNLYRHQSELTQELDRKKKACDELNNRLSKVMSSQLADNNPHIVDLSNQNRPTRLVEQFSELYDNEWTNAYAALQNIIQDEHSIVCFLRRVLEVCFTHCRQLSVDQLHAAKRKMCHRNREVQVAEIKSLKDARKKHAHLDLHFIYQLVFTILQNKFDSSILNVSQVQTYINQCTELCWLMSVQDPPMAINSTVARDSRFNRDMYKEYTRRGRFIDFVVWPVVLIQDGGAMMAKGVVECCGTPEDSRLLVDSQNSGTSQT